MLKNKAKQAPRPSDIGNVPHTAYTAAKAEWAERMGGPVVERARWFLMSICLVVALAAALWAIGQMAPLKTAVPYIIEVDKVTGEAKASTVRPERFVVGEAQKKYFLGRWVRKTVELDPYTTEADIKEAFTFVRGKASDEYRALMTMLKPMERLAKEKGLTRVVSISTINFITTSSALIRFSAEERTIGSAPVTKRYVANIHFELVPPTTEKEILENPNGIFITHFAFQEEIQ